MQVSPTKYVFLSKTRDNPHLPPNYADQQEADMDPRTASRMIDGRWVETEGESIYHAYKRANNFSKADYVINPREVVFLSWDFNIALGKPMSVCMFQFVNDHMHLFDEEVVHGMRTQDSCERIADKGYLDVLDKDGIPAYHFVITGDAAGRHKDTRSKQSDYDIIEKYFANYKIDKSVHKVSFERSLPSSNGSVRTRHALVNGYCENVQGKHRLTVYAKAPVCDEGLRLTQLKGANYIEDDSKEYQHVSTAIGYGLNVAKNVYSVEEKTSYQR